jgi:hypothetical protein
MQTVLQFNQAHTAAAETTFDPVPSDQCEANRPSDGTTLHVMYKRFVGVTFVPVAPGRYMATIFALAVGTQRGQFKGTAQLRWDYSGLPGVHVQLHVTRPGGGDSPLIYSVRGGYTLVASQPGRYEFELRLVGASGEVLHTDLASVDLP